MSRDDSAAAALAAHALDTAFDDLSAESREAVGKHLTDWVGLVLGGEALAESSGSVTDALDALTVGNGGSATGSGSEVGDGRATVLPTGERVAPWSSTADRFERRYCSS